MDPKSYIALLAEAGDLLQEMKDEELRSSPDPSADILALTGPFRYATRAQPPRPTSGFVEYQRLVARLRPKSAHSPS